MSRKSYLRNYAKFKLEKDQNRVPILIYIKCIVRTGILDRYPFRSARKIRDSEVQVENARRRRAEKSLFGGLKMKNTRRRRRKISDDIILDDPPFGDDPPFVSDRLGSDHGFGVPKP